MKSYKNIIIIGIILVLAATYWAFTHVNMDDLLVTAGVYDQKITIINTADVHGHIIYDDDVGGYYSLEDVSIIMGLPLMKHFVNAIRQQDKQVLLLDCGDLFHGTNEANIGKAKGVVEIANQMGYNGMVPGNHDFDFGIDRFLEIKKQLDFPMYCANLYQNGKLLCRPYRIFHVKGRKIAVLAVTTPYVEQFSNTRDFKGISSTDPVEAVKKYLPQLRSQADAVIVISHCGDDRDQELAKAVKGIDLILSAHLHALYKTPKIINGTTIAEPGGWSTHLGVSELYFKKGKLGKIAWSLRTTRDKTKADPTLNKIGQKYFHIAYETQKEVIGRSKVVLNGVRSLVRSQETNLGDLLADAMREEGQADFVIMNGGGIRQSIPSGPINIYKIGKILPFSNGLVVIKAKGDAIYKTLERGLYAYPAGDYGGGFMQVSGIRYVIDASKPAGQRLVSVTYQGRPLDRNKYYRVGTNDFSWNGGDGLEELAEQKLIYQGGLLKNVLIDYIRKKHVVNPHVEGRIKVINQRYK